MAEQKNKSVNTTPHRPSFGNPMGMRGPQRGMLSNAKPTNTKETIGRLWNYLSKRRARLTLVFIFTALSSGLMLLGPYLIGEAIDSYIIPKDYNGLLWLCLLLLSAHVLSSVAAWVQAYLMAIITQQTVWEIRNDLFSKIQTLPLKFFDSKSHGELMSRTTNDIENVSMTLNQSVTQIISSVLTLIGSLGMMIYLSPWLTLVSLVTIPLVLLITKQIARFTRKHFTSQQESLGNLNGFIEETISGQKVVTSLCREEKAKEEFNGFNNNLKHVGIKAQIFSGLMGPVMNFVNNLSLSIIAFAGGWMALVGLTTVGVVVSFINYSRQFGRPINELANLFNMIQAGIAGAERVFEIMDTSSEYEDNANRQLTNVKGDIEFKDVHFNYTKEKPTLQQVNLFAKSGETIALVGPTGAGKTTIVNLITRFYDIDHGEICIDGENIISYDKNSLRKQLGIVLQDAYLFADSIMENIRYGKLNATDEEIIHAAKMANADSFIRKLPNGYHTVLSSEGSNLSQGQRQLITIARAILADPKILILDEATSSVDTRTEMHIQEAMQTLMKGRTSFVIAHRLGTIRNADQILVINDGKVIEKGTHQQLLNKQGFYYQLYTRKGA